MDLKQSQFRLWVHQLWVQNCEERQIYRDGQAFSKQEYFARFRWWLRREWRHQQRGRRHPVALESPVIGRSS